MILSSQRSSLNKNGIGFKKDKKLSKGVDHKENKYPVYKCTHCRRVSYLKPFCFDKLKRFKGSNLRSYGTNAPGSKKMWTPKVKP